MNQNLNDNLEPQSQDEQPQVIYQSMDKIIYYEPNIYRLRKKIEKLFEQRLEYLQRGESVPSELQNELDEQLSLFYFSIDSSFEFKKEVD